MNINKETNYLNKLNKVYSLIDAPDIFEAKEKKPFILKRFLHPIWTKIKRVANFLFGDHHWINNKKASQIAKYYLFKASQNEINPERTTDIKLIINRLLHIQKGKNSTYGKGLEESMADVASKSEHHSSLHIVKDLPRIDNKLLFHIHGNKFGAGSKLEGTIPGIPLQYFYEFLKKRQTDHLPLYGLDDPNQLLYELDVAIKLTNYSLAVRKQIISESIAAGKPFLMYGGWTGKSSGHAIYHHVIPQDNGTVNIRVCNLGSGVNNHQQAQNGVAIQYAPDQEWKGINADLLSQDSVLRVFWEFQNMKSYPGDSDSNTDFNETDIYMGLKDLLKPTEIVNIPLDPEHYKSTQESGICGWKSLMAFASRRMTQENYKKMILDIKLQSLTDRISLLPKEKKNRMGHEDKIVQFHLIQRSWQSVCRRLERMYTKGLVTDHYYMQARYNLNRAAKWVKQNEIILLEKTKIELPEVSNKLNYNMTSILFYKSKPYSYSLSASQPCTHVVDDLKKFEDFSDPTKFTNQLKDILARGEEAWKNKEYHALHVGLIHLIFKLPPAWFVDHKTDPQVAQEQIAILGDIAHLFFKTCFMVPESTIIHSEHIYGMGRIVFLLEVLAQQAKVPYLEENEIISLRSSLKFYDFFLSVFDKKILLPNLPENPGTNVKKLDQELHVIDSRFFYGYNIGYQTQSQFFNDTGVDTIERIDPEIRNKIAREDANWLNYNVAGQVSRILTSSLLPKWLCALRDTNYYLRYLKEGPVARPYIHSDSFTIRYEYQDSDTPTPYSSAYIHLKDTERLTSEFSQVKFISDNPSYRYALMYRTIASTELKELVDFILNDGTSLNEKGLLSLDVKDYPNIKMLDEDFKELVHLFLPESRTLSVSKTLEYFTKYHQKLLDPDYQVLFKILVFNSKHISKEDHPVFVQKLEAFFAENLEHLMVENNIQAAVFTLQLGRYFSSYFPASVEFKKCEEHLHILLERKELEVEERSLVWGELMAHHRKKETLTDAELAELLVGLCYRQDYPVPTQWREPVTDRDVRDAVAFHAKALEKYLLKGAKPNEKLLNNILHIFCPEADSQEWNSEQSEGQFPAFITKDGAYRYYPLNGQLLSMKKRIYLPLSIREHPYFIKLFNKNTKVRLHADGNYTFKHNGKKTRIFWRGENLIIEQQLKSKQWYRFLPSSLFVYQQGKNIDYPLGSRYLADRFTHWQSLENPEKIFLLDPKTGKEIYLAKRHSVKRPNSRYFNNDDIKSVLRLSDNAKLCHPSDLLTRFEDASYIHEWRNRWGCLVEIELLRYGLSFKGLKCDQFPDYHLVPHHNIPLLGTFRNYLVIENKAGQKKIIMPYQQFKSSEMRESLLPKYEIEKHMKIGQTDPETYFVFDLKSNGHLDSNSEAACLYLSLVLSTVQQYTSAAHYLKKQGIKPGEFTRVEVEILNKINKNITGDESGDAIALRLFAAYLLIKNKNANPAYAISLYHKYLTKLNAVTALKLEPHEELHLLKAILSLGYDEGMYRRLLELDSSYAMEYSKNKPIIKHPKENETIGSTKNPINLMGNHFYTSVNGTFKLKNSLITRPLLYLKANIRYFYDLAINGNEFEKQWIFASLSFLKQSDDNESQGLYQLFKAILKKPDMFPPLPKEKANISEWWKKIVGIVTSIEIESSAQSKSLKPQIPDVTAADFRLEAAKPQIEPIKINYPSVNPPQAFAQAAKNCFKEIAATEKGTNAWQKLWNWLTEVRKTTEDTLVGNEIDRLKDHDMPEHQKQRNAKTLYTFEDNGLNQIGKILESQKNENSSKIQELETSIRALAAKNYQDIMLKLRTQNNLDGKKQRPLTLKRVMGAYARKMPELLKAANPALSEVDINELFRLTEEYLLLSTQEQQRTRCIEVYKQIEALQKKKGDHTKKLAHLVQELAEKMLAERQFKPQLCPAYLLLEKVGNIQIRKDQIDKLNEFLESGDMNPIMEMIMGSGKSKVLLPLLGLLRADGKKVSTLIVPQSLFGTNADDIHKVMQSYGVKVRALHFERNTTFTKASLETMLTDLKGIRDRREILIMTSKSVQCLILKFIEKCEQHYGKKEVVEEYSSELKMLAEILSIIGQCSNPNLDEADTLLNVLHEVCFSLGNTLSPRDEDLQVESLLYELLFTNTRLRSLARFECDPSPEQAPLLTAKLYEDKMKRAFAEEFMKALDKITYESDELTEKVRKYAQQVNHNPDELALALSYLTHTKVDTEIHQKYFDSQSEEIQDVLALAAMQISSFMSHTLLRTCDENYGIDDESVDLLAVPFAAAKTPNKGSQFANEHITINFTIQTYLKKSLPNSVIEKVLQNLQKKVRDDFKKGIQKKDSKAWKKFCELKGDYNMSLFKYKSEDIVELHKKINADINTKLKCITRLILPNLQLFEKKMSCNSLNLVAFFKILSGFTGTLWNGKSMHGKIDPRPALGTDSKTLSFLWENSLDSVHTIKEGTALQMLSELQEKGVTYDVVSDSGGYFKTGANNEIAQTIEKFLKKPVVFFRKDKLDITTGNYTTTPPKNRLTFLDQIHTVGSDVKQKRNARAILTISRNMLLRDLLQSAWRLRELDKSQRVIFVMTHDVEEIIRETLKLTKVDKITFREILLFTIHNQSKRQGLDNFKTLKQEMKSISQGILLESLLNPKLTAEQRNLVFQELRNTWIKPTYIRPKDLFGQIVMERDSKKIIELEIDDCNLFLDKLFAKLPFLADSTTYQDYKNDINKIVERLKDHVPKKVMSPDPNVDKTMEREQEKQAEKERENELETQQMKYSSLDNLGVVVGDMYEVDYSDITKNYTYLIPLSQIMAKEDNLAPYANAFADIRISINALQWTQKQKMKRIFQLLGKQRNPFHFLRVADDKVWILSEEEAKKMKIEKAYAQNKKDPIHKEELYNLTLGFLFKEEKLRPSAFEKITKIKFLNGESSYNKPEQDFLKKWLSENDPVIMKKLFTGPILNGRPNKRKAYFDESSLHSIFKELII